MSFKDWIKRFGILRDGDYLGFSDEDPEPNEFLPMLFDIEIIKDSDFIWEKMNENQSLVWSVFKVKGIAIAKNGFEPDAIGYYVGTVSCKRKTFSVKVEI
ncbi:MAG: hypothetical protein DRN14_05355 [Thermoplasmata archaeon]|nr:MAG: hypothetical protein DRN14_05355 [Thermoplasmata archaeon]